MQNLIYLILIVLSAGAGYMAGSWSGKDARQALELAQKGAEKIVEKRDTLQADLDAALKAKKAEHDAELAKRQASFDAATAEFNKKLADSSNKVKALQRSSNAAMQRATDLTARLATAKPEEVASMKNEIARLLAQASSQQAEARGNVCLQEKVPVELLADLRVEAL